MEGRTKRFVRNAGVAIAMHVVSMVLAVISRTMFARFLAAEYLGLSGLFSNIISVLSLSELGIGSVIIVHLYKPLASGDEDQICRLMNFYRRAYTCIGIAVAACGIVLVPFLDKLVKYDGSIPYLGFYFLLFVLQSASSYFFSYKTSLLTASQNEYICSLVRQSFDLLMKILQIVVLCLSRQYVVFLVVPIFTSLASNIVISCIVDKKFPFLRKNRHLKMDKTQTRGMFQNVSSMMLHKVGNTVISSTDNILISSMIGIVYTGLYSNYILIMNMISVLITMCFSAVSASVGDFNAQKTLEERKSLFETMCFLSTWIFGMGAICFACLYQPTIRLWLGESYLLDFGVVLIMSVNFFVNGLTRVPGTFSDVNGLYVKTKFKPIAMAVINLVASVICLRLWGLIGVLIGTLISYLLIGLWVDPYVLYKDVFHLPAHTYFLPLLKHVFVVGAIGTITYGVVQIIPWYLGKVAVAVLVSNGLLLLCHCRTKELRYLLVRIKNLLPQKSQMHS